MINVVILFQDEMKVDNVIFICSDTKKKKVDAIRM